MIAIAKRETCNFSEGLNWRPEDRELNLRLRDSTYALQREYIIFYPKVKTSRICTVNFLDILCNLEKFP